jgi:hypothetical protein
VVGHQLEILCVDIDPLIIGTAHDANMTDCRVPAFDRPGASTYLTAAAVWGTGAQRLDGGWRSSGLLRLLNADALA